jgi:hypothetical protein
MFAICEILVSCRLLRGDAVVELGSPSLQVAGACSIKIEAMDATVVSAG